MVLNDILIPEKIVSLHMAQCITVQSNRKKWVRIKYIFTEILRNKITINLSIKWETQN